jgi:hypothetical protein
MPLHEVPRGVELYYILLSLHLALTSDGDNQNSNEICSMYSYACAVCYFARTMMRRMKCSRYSLSQSRRDGLAETPNLEAVTLSHVAIQQIL